MAENVRDELGLEHERFLIQEGLCALASYRAIKSQATRLSIVCLMYAMAEAETSGDTDGGLVELAKLKNALLTLEASSPAASSSLSG